MDNFSDIKQLFIDNITKNIYPYYFNTAKTEISIRCIYCGDSVNSPKSAHLYIELNNPTCFKFYCQKCNEGGMVTPDFLKDIHIYDNELNLALFKLNKNLKYKKKNLENYFLIGGNIKRKKLTFPKLEGTIDEYFKLKYVIDRLGVEFKAKEAAEKYKIILNFEKFIEHNKITIFTERDKVLDSLNDNCVGFLSYDQSHIIFRSINPEITRFRYHNYNIFGNYENSKRMYTIKTSIDILKPKINVIVTEGILDILGVYNHFYKDKKEDNHIFIAVNGKGYSLIFQNLARMGFLDMDIEIYSDNDVNRRFYQNMKKYNSILKNNKIKLYYNTIGKDFGVEKNKK